MTRRYPDLASASDWFNQISHAARPIKGTTQIWIVKRHMARNLGHRVSCDLRSGCHAMILTAGFHDDSGLKLFVKIKWSNTTMFMVK